MSEKIIIFDTTLRDGEQSPGASMNIDEKIQLAHQLARLNVDVIEAEVDDYLEHLLQQWRKPLVEVRGKRFYQPVYTAPWNVDYCIDALLEHALVHPMRHRFQLQELME